MDKPTEPELSINGSLDYDLAERVVRQMQGSAHVVCSAHVVTSLPPPLATGTPEDELAGIFVDLALITDGRRGWLVLVDAVPEYDEALEITEFLDDVMQGAGARHAVVRGATMHDSMMSELSAAMRADILDLRDTTRVREVVERAYEDAFGPRPEAIEHDELLARFRSLGYAVRLERELREMCVESDEALEAVRRAAVDRGVAGSRTEGRDPRVSGSSARRSDRRSARSHQRRERRRGRRARRRTRAGR